MYLNKVNFSESTLLSLEVYASLLKKWQKTTNLVSNNSIKDAWNRHFLDSAQLYNLLPTPLANSYVYDLGSGAGFPGMVLAMMGRKDIVLCESNKKKCSFLEEVAESTKTEVNIVNIRVQKIQENTAIAIVCRALASLDVLLDISIPILKAKGVCIFPKGKSWRKEISNAKKKYILNYKAIKSITSDESAIVIINNVLKKNV